jgi:membrane protease YdiL (CAAX protease family)
MTPTSSKFSTKSFLGFLAFAYGWTWFFWMVAAVIGTTIWASPAVILFVLGGLGVPLGGIVMTRLSYGANAPRDLARRIIDPKHISAPWWAVILLFFPVLTLLAGALAVATGATQQPFDLTGAVQSLTHPAALAATILFTLVIGPLPEEIGWRGYLFDHAHTRLHALSASLFVGFVNWLWHLPLFYLPGYSEAFRTVPPTMLQMFFIVVPVGVLYAWAYNNTRRSVLAAILLHFGGNFWGEFLGLSPEAQTYRVVLTIIAVVFIAWYWGPTTLRRGPVLAVAH